MARRGGKSLTSVRLAALSPPPSVRVSTFTDDRDRAERAVAATSQNVVVVAAAAGTDTDDEDGERDGEADEEDDEPEDDLLIRKAAEQREEERRSRAEQAEESELAEKIVESESRDVEREAAWEKSLSQDGDDDDDDFGGGGDVDKRGADPQRKKSAGRKKRGTHAHGDGDNDAVAAAAEKEAAVAKKQKVAEEKERRADEKRQRLVAERAEKKRVREEKKVRDKAERERNRRYVSDYRAERASHGGQKFRTSKSKPLDASGVGANSFASDARSTSGLVVGGVVDVIAEADGLMRLVDDGDASLTATSGRRAGSGSSSSISTGSDYSVAVELRRRYRRFEEFFLAFHVSLEDALAVLAQVKNAALVATEEVAPGHRLRDSPWGRDLMDEVTRRREIYKASDLAIARASVPTSTPATKGGKSRGGGGGGGGISSVNDGAAVSDDHVAAMWKCVVVPMARYYVHQKREQVELRADNMRRLLDGDLWQWISASSEDQQRAFRSQYTLRFGPPKTKSKKPGRAAHSSPASRKRKGAGTGSAAEGEKKARTSGGGDGDAEDGDDDSDRDGESARQTKTSGRRAQSGKKADGNDNGDDEDVVGGGAADGAEKKRAVRYDHAAYDFSHLGDADIEVLWRLMALITLKFAPPSWTRSFVVPKNLW